MKVLQVNRYFSPKGGSETVMFETMDMLKRHGHEVVPFSMHSEKDRPSEYSSFFVGSVLLEPKASSAAAVLSPARLPSLGSGLYSREAARCLEALLRVSEPDLAHLHSIYHQLSPSVLRPLRKRGIPTVMTLHDYKLVCPSSIMFANGKICERCEGHRYYNAVIQGCVHDSRLKSVFCTAESYLHGTFGMYTRNVDMYIAPSRFMKQKMTEFGLDGDRIVHVPNPLNLDNYAPGSGSDGYYLFSGRLEEVKGVQTLLEAVAGSEMARRFELRIAGDGRQRAALEEYCRRHGLTNVRFMGWLSQTELAALHRKAMFAVVPSIWYEVFSLAVLEAQAYAKAVIGAKIGGIPELIEEGTTGLLFEPGNAGDLAKKIEYLLADAGRSEEMGKRAREVVEGTCAPDRQYKRLMEVYDRAMESRREPVTVGAAVEGERG